MSGGTLHVVGTPIGNLADLSPRASDALATADLVACEDTRRTGRLLQLTGIGKRRLTVINEHTEMNGVKAVIEALALGQNVALVSDAGMPGISDPGELLIRAVLDAGYEVEVVPGPTAMTTALVLSGLGTRRFVFEGFLPRKGQERAEALADIATQRRTVVVYESPKRISATLADIIERCGPGRHVAVARELTKLHQQVLRGPAKEVLASLEDGVPKGEIVLIIAGYEPEVVTYDDDTLTSLLRSEMSRGSSRRDAVGAVMASTGEPKRRLYDLANALVT